MPKIVIAGCGFLGGATAAFFCRAGWQVTGLCRTAPADSPLQKLRVDLVPCDLTQSFSLPASAHGTDVLIYSASSRGGDAAAYQSIYVEGLLNAIAAVKPRRSLFVSSTSVYPQTDGSWVDESSETDGEREKSAILLEAERIALACGGYVARLAGLYGPGRSVLRERFLSGGAVVEKSGSRWINQIQRDDAATALFHLFEKRAPVGIYNVADDHPATQKEVYSWLAAHFHRPMPPETEEERPRKRGNSNKRVCNIKLRGTEWAPFYPSYRHALATLD